MSLRTSGYSDIRHGSDGGCPVVPVLPYVADQNALISGVTAGGSAPPTPSLVCHSSVRPPAVTGAAEWCQVPPAGGDSHSDHGTSSAECSGSGAAGAPVAGSLTTGTSCGVRPSQASRPAAVNGIEASAGSSNASQLGPASASSSGGSGRLSVPWSVSSPWCCGGNTTTTYAGWLGSVTATYVWPFSTTISAL